MDLYSLHDPRWVTDFQEALKELVGDEKLLPPSQLTEPTCVVAVASAEEPDISTLHGAALRTAILERMHISKTANPYIREVHFGGVKVGSVAQCSWAPFLWLSSASKRTPFYSMTESSVFTVYNYLGCDGDEGGPA